MIQGSETIFIGNDYEALFSSVRSANPVLYFFMSSCQELQNESPLDMSVG